MTHSIVEHVEAENTVEHMHKLVRICMKMLDIPPTREMVARAGEAGFMAVFTALGRPDCAELYRRLKDDLG